MKTCDLKLGDVVRYKGNGGYYMDMSVVKVSETEIVLHRPYVFVDHGVLLKAETCVFHPTSNMEWELRSWR